MRKHLSGVPRREAKLNRVFASQGGIRQHVFDLLENGERMDDIAASLTEACGERIPADTLYQWVRRWRLEKLDRVSIEKEVVAP